MVELVPKAGQPDARTLACSQIPEWRVPPRAHSFTWDAFGHILWVWWFGQLITMYRHCPLSREDGLWSKPCVMSVCARHDPQHSVCVYSCNPQNNPVSRPCYVLSDEDMEAP